MLGTSEASLICWLLLTGSDFFLGGAVCECRMVRSRWRRQLLYANTIDQIVVRDKHVHVAAPPRHTSPSSHLMPITQAMRNGSLARVSGPPPRKGRANKPLSRSWRRQSSTSLWPLDPNVSKVLYHTGGVDPADMLHTGKGSSRSGPPGRIVRLLRLRFVYLCLT